MTSPGSRAAWSFVILAALIFCAATINLLWTAHEVNSSNHRWCATLVLLTARPVPSPTSPSSNPSRENAYVFYRNLLDLRDRFGC